MRLLTSNSTVKLSTSDSTVCSEYYTAMRAWLSDNPIQETTPEDPPGLLQHWMNQLTRKKPR